MKRMAFGVGLQRLEHALEPLLELAAELGAGEQGAHVERVDLRVAQRLRDLVAVDAQRQALGDGGLAHAGLAHVERVVLPPPAEHLDGALELLVAADERIDPALRGLVVEQGGVGGERIPGGARTLVVVVTGRHAVRILLLALLLLLAPAVLAQAVADVVEEVHPRHPLLLQEVERVALVLAEEGDEHVPGVDELLVRGEGVDGRAVQHALHADRLLRIALVVLRQALDRLLQELLQALGQALHAGAAGLQDLLAPLVGGEGEQHVLQGQVLVPQPLGSFQGATKALLQFLGDDGGGHVSPPPRAPSRDAGGTRWPAPAAPRSAPWSGPRRGCRRRPRRRPGCVRAS